MVGNGTPEEAKAFRAERAPSVPLYVDPRLRAYRAAGLRRNLGGIVSLKVLAAAKRAHAEGHSQGRTAGEPWQLGGVFVIRPDGAVPFAQRSDSAGDHADPAAVLASLA